MKKITNNTQTNSALEDAEVTSVLNSAHVIPTEKVKGEVTIGRASGGSGTTNYNQLTNKPKINSVELIGNKTSDNLGLQDKLIAGANITISGSTISADKGSTVSGTEDGTNWSTITIDGTTRNIPSGGGGGEPSEYLKRAVVSQDGNTLTITPKTGGNIVFTPHGSGGSTTWGSIGGTLSNQTDLQTALDAKQATISDIGTIRTNATAGASAATTISTYGDVVTHNASEFATSAQGVLADSAVQPGNNVSTLTNDAGYVDSSYHDSTKENVISDLSDIRSGASLGTTALQPNTAIVGATKSKITYDSNGLVTAGTDLLASDIPYTNPLYTTVGAALDKLLYIAPVINSFNGGGIYETGQSISSITFTWSINKTITSQSITDVGSLDPSLRSYLYTLPTPLTSNKNYTLTVGDGTNTATRSTSVTFYNKYYCGVSELQTLTDAQILAFSDQGWATSRKLTRTFNCTGGKYFYIVLPTTLCSGITFKVGGLAFSDMNVVTRDVVNASGATISYNIYRPNNLQTGSAISVEVI